MARNRYDIDETLESGFNISQLKRLAHYVGPHKNKMILAIVLMLTSSALSMLFPRFLRNIMDFYIPAGDIGAIVRTSFLMLFLTVVICLISCA